MRLTTALKIGAAVFVVSAIGVVAAVKSVDVESYRQIIADAARNATGRELTINGRFDLKPSLNPTIVAEDVVFANAPWGTRPQMVQVKRVEAQIGLLPLLTRQVQVRSLLLVQPDVLIETDKAGRGNWELLTAGGAAEQKSPQSGQPTVIKVGEVKVEKAKVTWLDGRQGTATSMELAELIADAESFSSPVGLSAKGQIGDRLFDLRGVLGPVLETQVQTKPYPVKLKLTSGGIVASVDGTISQVRQLAGYDIKVGLEGSELAELSKLINLRPGLVGPFRIGARLSDAKGPLQLSDIDGALGRRDVLLISAKGMVREPLAGRGFDVVVNAESENLAALSDVVGAPLPAVGPVRLSAHVTDPQPDNYRLTDLKLGLGRSDVTGEGAVQLGGAVPTISAHLASTMLDLDDLTPPTKGRVRPISDPDRLFSAEPLPFETLKQANLDVTLKADRMVLAGALAHQVDLKLALNNGRLSVRPFSAGLAGGRLAGEFTADAAAAPPQVALKVKADKIDLGAVLRETKTTDVLDGGPADIAVDLRGAGETMRAVMGSLGGDVALVVGKGTLNDLDADLIALDVLRQATPWAEKVRDTQMQCLVGRFTIGNGLATSQSFLFDTSHMTVGGTGKINLGNEGLNLTIVPKPKEASLLTLATAMDVGGTIMHPSVMPNKAAIAKGVVGAVGAVALGPLGALVPFVSAGSGNDNPCLEALSGGKKGGTKAAKPSGVGDLLNSIFGN